MNRQGVLIALSALAATLAQAGEPSLVHTLKGHSDSVRSVAFNRSGNLLLSGGDDRSVLMWNAKNGKYVHALREHGDWVRAVAVSPDRKYFASADDDGVILLRWMGDDGFRFARLKGHEASVKALAFSPDGAWLASGGNDEDLRLWPVTGQAPSRVLRGHESAVNAVAFSPGGKLLASGGGNYRSGRGTGGLSEDYGVRLWRVEDGRMLRRMKGHSNEVAAVAFSPDGKVLASGGADLSIRFWRVSDGSELRVLKTKGHVEALAFSPGGKLLASGEGDGIHLRYAPSGADLWVLREGDAALSVAFSPDGSLIASAHYDGDVRLWRAPAAPVPSAYFKEGQRHIAARDRDKAEAALRMAVRLEPGNARYRNALGALYHYMGEHDAAIEQFQAIPVEAGPDAEVLYRLLGNSLYERGRYEEAYGPLSAAVKKTPDGKGAKSRELARERLERLEKHRKRRAEAEEAEKKGRLRKAKREMEAALEILDAPVAKEGLSRIEDRLRRRSGRRTRTALLAACGFTVVGALFLLDRRRRGREAASSRLVSSIRSKLGQAKSEGGSARRSAAAAEAGKLFREYCGGMGSPADFGVGELAVLLSGEGLSRTAERLPVEKALPLAKRFAESGDTEKAALLLTGRVLVSAPSIARGVEDIVEIFERAGALGKLVERLSRIEGPPELFSSYAQALNERGLPQEAFEVISMKPVRQWDPYDAVMVFELNLRLGRFEPAHLMLDRVVAERPPEENGEVYYGLAGLAEKGNAPRLAADIYRLLVERGIRHKDVEDRLERLKAVLSRPKEAPVEEPRPPEMIGGKYELGRRIGEGGIGAVFEARDLRMDRIVAIKRMHPAIRAHRSSREMFLRGAKALAHLTHPYIVGILDIVEEGDEIYLILEYFDGRPLSRLLEERGRIGLKQSERIFECVCQGVDAAHRMRILHRDLKPSNIMVDATGLARVMDFDLAREAKDAISRLTHREAVGTPAYMSPEQHLGEAHRASDIFALGVTLYEMLTGKLPYPGPDFLVQKERRKFVPPSRLVPGLPRDVDLLVSATLEPDHARRLGDPLELLEALRKIVPSAPDC